MPLKLIKAQLGNGASNTYIEAKIHSLEKPGPAHNVTFIRNLQGKWVVHLVAVDFTACDRSSIGEVKDKMVEVLRSFIDELAIDKRLDLIARGLEEEIPDGE